MTLKDSTEHIQGCLMYYDVACNGNMESHDVLWCKVKFELPRSAPWIDPIEWIVVSEFKPLLLDKCVNASGPTTVHEGSYPSTLANKLR